mmetsp:Transcript_29966/g.91748  ORF Transcript_29966/g.91748 Transcript_29966/m.91748 type:complete len:473 (-) Transcript_29966:367-1785(-)
MSTRRIQKDDAVPAAAKRVMEELLASNIPNRHAYLQATPEFLANEGDKHVHRSSTRQEEPHIFDEFASSNALHYNFRMFATFGKTEMIEAVLKEANEEVRDYYLHSSSQKHDETALTLAAKYAKTEVLHALLERGQRDLDHAAPGGTALTWTCRSLSPEHFKKNEPAIIAAAFGLLYAGADPNVENEHGHTALDYAVANESPSLVSLLRRHGAEPGRNPRSSSERCLYSEDTKEATSPEELVEATTFGVPPSLKKRLVDALKTEPDADRPLSVEHRATDKKFFTQANERYFEIEDQQTTLSALSPRLAAALTEQAKLTLFGGEKKASSTSSKDTDASNKSNKSPESSSFDQILAGLSEKLTYKIRSTMADDADKKEPDAPPSKKTTTPDSTTRVYQIDAESLQVLVVSFEKTSNKVYNGLCPPCNSVDLAATLTGKVTFVQAKDHPTFINLQVNLLKNDQDLDSLLYNSIDN